MHLCVCRICTLLCGPMPNCSLTLKWAIFISISLCILAFPNWIATAMLCEFWTQIQTVVRAIITCTINNKLINQFSSIITPFTKGCENKRTNLKCWIGRCEIFVFSHFVMFNFSTDSAIISCKTHAGFCSWMNNCNVDESLLCEVKEQIREFVFWRTKACRFPWITNEDFWCALCKEFSSLIVSFDNWNLRGALMSGLISSKQ